MPQPRRLIPAAAAGAAAAALAASPALARIDPPPTPAFNAREPTPPVVIVRNVDAGFDWGAAAIGAGGTGALAVVVALGTAALSTRQQIGVKR
jgi:hypothetical protein